MDYRTIPLGAKRDKHDPRDLKKARVGAPMRLPPDFAIMDKPPIKDQGQRNSCTGHASAWMWEQVLASRGVTREELSPLFTWYYGRASEGTAGEDSGVTMRGAIAALASRGACPLSLWGYDRPIHIEPDQEAQLFGAAYKLPRYERCESIDAIRHCLAVEKQSAIISLPVFENWYADSVTRTGHVPEAGGSTMVGYHAVAACGYDDRFGWLKFANSWGRSWGEGGYGYVPYETLELFGYDCWSAGFDILPDAT